MQSTVSKLVFYAQSTSAVISGRCKAGTGCFELAVHDAPLEEFMYLVFTRMPGESHRGRVRSFRGVVLV